MELAWVKGGPKLAERLIQERFNQDRDQLANTHQVTELGDIAGCLDGLQGLAHLRLHHQELARTLMRIRDRLRERERSLQSRYGQAKAEVVRRKSELRRVQEEQSSARADLATVLRGSLNNQKVDDRIQSISEFTLHKKNEERLNQLTAQYSEVDAELAGVKRERAPLEEAIERESRRWFPSKRRLVGLQENRTYLSNQQKKLEGRLAQIERERNQLRKQKMQTSRPVSQDRATRATRTVDYTRKKAIEDRLARLGENETAMKAELKEAQEQQKALEAQLSQLTAFTRSLSYLCDEMLAVALSYNSDQMLTRVLARNRALNFDYVLARPARNTSAAALRSIGSLTRAHTRDVIAAVAQFTSTASGIVEVQDLSKLNDLSRELAGILEHATFQRYVELLADTFHSLLAELITQRPLGQASLLLRAAVRYCAWGLAECLSYWLATVQVSASQSPNQPGRQGVNPQHVLDAYLDIAVTLALLEERIEGSLQPNEGIVLVRERRENVQQAAP